MVIKRYAIAGRFRPIWLFLQIRDPFCECLYNRALLRGGLYWGPLIVGDSHLLWIVIECGKRHQVLWFICSGRFVPRLWGQLHGKGYRCTVEARKLEYDYSQSRSLAPDSYSNFVESAVGPLNLNESRK